MGWVDESYGPISLERQQIGPAAPAGMWAAAVIRMASGGCRLELLLLLIRRH
jgi:hypothetical protein